MSNTDRARKLLVRTALVTSATIATLVGAQNLALLDMRQLETNALTSVTVDAVLTPAPLIMENAPSLTIQKSSPSIVILRQSGQTNSVSRQPVGGQNVILPPSPQTISAPAPVIVQQQQPVEQRTRSSR